MNHITSLFTKIYILKERNMELAVIPLQSKYDSTFGIFKQIKGIAICECSN